MSSRKLVVRRSRFFRVLLGGTIAMFSLLVGVAFAFHSTLVWTLHDTPTDVSAEQLLTDGVGENGLLRLTDVRIPASPSKVNLFRADQAYPLDRSGRIVMPLTSEEDIQRARLQISRTGGLVGRVNRDEVAFAVLDLVKDYGVEPSEIAELEKLPKRETYPYVLELIDTTDESFIHRKQLAAKNMAIAGIVAVFGLIIAGSGGSGIIGWFLFTVPVVFCVPGMFLRYGRGNAATRLMYLVAGVALIGGGYYLTFFENKIASPQTSPMLAPAGFLLATFGAAAILGAFVNQLFGGIKATASNIDRTLLQRPKASPDPRTAEILHTVAAQSGTTVAPGLHLEQPVVRYQDPHVMIAADPDVDEPTALMATGFEALDFEAPLVLDVGDGETFEKQTMQIGCRNLALVVNLQPSDDDSDSVRTRLFSVLENGQVIVTLSAGTPANAGERKHSGGMIVVAQSADPAKLLSAHLENTVRAAEIAGTSICNLHPGEWRDAYAYGHRVMADIGHQNGDNPYKVFPSTHGRFRFPAQPVEELQTVG